MADITIVNGVYKPTYNWGAPSCMYLYLHRIWPFMVDLPGKNGDFPSKNDEHGDLPNSR